MFVFALCREADGINGIVFYVYLVDAVVVKECPDMALVIRDYAENVVAYKSVVGREVEFCDVVSGGIDEILLVDDEHATEASGDPKPVLHVFEYGIRPVGIARHRAVDYVIVYELTAFAVKTTDSAIGGYPYFAVAVFVNVTRAVVRDGVV